MFQMPLVFLYKQKITVLSMMFEFFQHTSSLFAINQKPTFFSSSSATALFKASTLLFLTAVVADVLHVSI